jgi:hypothetical protein
MKSYQRFLTAFILGILLFNDVKIKVLIYQFLILSYNGQE